MLTFQYGYETVRLRPGESWAVPSEGDSYRDTTVEKLRTIVAEVEQGTPWRDVIASHYAKQQPWLHQIIADPARTLFFRQHPPSPGTRILDIGAGWGQIALPLTRAGHALVTALEPTPERLAFIRAVATQEHLMRQMTFIQAGFQELTFTPDFDLVCCIGVLEWVPKFQPGNPRELQLQFLRGIRAALKPGGRCYLGIENRLGLKYLLGARDDHTGQRLVSVFDAELAAAKHQASTRQTLRVFTYTHAEYTLLFAEAGFARIETHAAYPDYKLPQLILPFDSPIETNTTLLHAAIPPEHDGVDGHLLPNPEEYASHYRSLARMGVAHFFCPSFFFILQ